MTIIDQLNQAINYLYEIKDTPSALIKPYALASKIGVSIPVAERILIQLEKDKLAICLRRSTEISYEAYGIHYNAVALVLERPDEYIQRPYSYYIKLKEDEDAKVREIKEQEGRLRESMIETNNAIAKNAADQKKIGVRTLIAISASALFFLATIVSSIILRDSQTPQILQQQSRSLENLELSLRNLDTALQKAVKDSFYQKHR